MSKFELVVLSIMAVVLVWFGWDNENAVPLYQLAIFLGGIVFGAVMVFALDERVGGE
jgi:hypothetical protein